MNKMLIAVFETEAKAYEGLSALKGLHENGDITLYASVVINKDQNGKIRVKGSTRSGPHWYWCWSSYREFDRFTGRPGGGSHWSFYWHDGRINL